MARILLVEDDAEIRRALIHALGDLGHSVTTAGEGLRGLQLALESEPELVVLDLGLPDVDGRDVLRMLRTVSQVPVIVATARDQESTIVEALNRGADDYLSKPFGAAQLDARIRAVLRRSAGGRGDASQPLVLGGLRIDPAAREAQLDGATLELTAREFDLLSYLATRAGTVVTKRELINEVWRQPYSGTDKTVDVHLSWLRRKLGENAREPRFLHTVRGIGVKFAAGAQPPTR
ncbi:response regulator transcription factor [Dactylosporangium sp. McL0621]|uniref:response regulator transcription factor n=1 Tax=Dactylosporangium sp. McL0621 TaxID=3415678 RepID=UPI003CF316AD